MTETLPSASLTSKSDAANGAGRSREAVTAWHGPEGELAIGSLDHEKLRSLLLSVSLPSFVLLVIDRRFTTFLIAFGSLFLVSRLASMRGTPKLVSAATVHWCVVFAATSLGLLLISHATDTVPSLYVVYLVSALIYAWGITVRFSTKRLVAWKPQKATGPAVSDASLEYLKTLRGEILLGRQALSSLKVFDKNDETLVNAWKDRDVGTIAERLQAGDMLTQDSWRAATGAFNRAVSICDTARARLRILLGQTESALAPFKINYKAIEADKSKMAYGYTSFAIPKTLNAKRMDLQLLLYGDSKSRMAARFAGDSKPLQVAWKTWSVLSASPLPWLYKSKWLRQLKDTEGELFAKAKAVQGDCNVIATMLDTRVIPHLDGMIEVIGTLETGLTDFRPGDATELTAKRDEALRLAFAVVLGRTLLETKAGN